MNVNYINVFIPAWMVPPMYHSLRRESGKASKRHDHRMQWGSRLSVPHGLKTKLLPELLPKEPRTRSTLCMDHDSPSRKMLSLREQPRFAALEVVAARGLLAAETWQCNKSHISLKATIDVPLLGSVIEQNGDGLLEDSLMPVGWPLHLDGAVKQ